MIRREPDLVRDTAGQWYCPYCWRRHGKRFIHDCPNEQAPAAEPGLGDRVEAWLKSRGITQEYYGRVKEEFGLPPGCDCDARIDWLNRVSRWWGEILHPKD